MEETCIYNNTWVRAQREQQQAPEQANAEAAAALAEKQKERDALVAEAELLLAPCDTTVLIFSARPDPPATLNATTEPWMFATQKLDGAQTCASGYCVCSEA